MTVGCRVISANTFYNPEWNEGKVLSSDIISDLFFAKYYGVKTRYYQNTKYAGKNLIA